MGYEFIKVESSDHVTLVTINRPEVMNALHPAANQELDDAWNAFEEDPEAWVGIITGEGKKAFSAGNDLKWQAQHGGKAIRDSRGGLRGGFGGLINRKGLNKPLIAAVNGFALGGGCEIALSCDIIIASTNASMGLPEPRVGLMAAAGGVHRLPRQVPYHIAMGVMLAGKRLSAEEALRYGLVNEVVEPDALIDTAKTWAREILKGAPLSVQATKEAAVLGMGMPLGHALESTFPTAARMFNSEDFVEGPKAFSEKRTPNWQGR